MGLKTLQYKTFKVKQNSNFKKISKMILRISLLDEFFFRCNQFLYVVN